MFAGFSGCVYYIYFILDRRTREELCCPLRRKKDHPVDAEKLPALPLCLADRLILWIVVGVGVPKPETLLSKAQDEQTAA